MSPSRRTVRTVVESTAYAVVERVAGGSVEVQIRHEAPHLCIEVIADDRLGDLDALDARVTALGGEIVVAGKTLRVTLLT